MGKDKPITTIPELVSALKRAGYATKDDLKTFATRDDFKNFATKDDVREIVGAEIENRRLATKGDLQKLERSLKRRMGKDHNEIKVNISKVATSSPTYDQFKDLKQKVDRFHPTS